MNQPRLWISEGRQSCTCWSVFFSHRSLPSAAQALIHDVVMNCDSQCCQQSSAVIEASLIPPPPFDTVPLQGFWANRDKLATGLTMHFLLAHTCLCILFFFLYHPRNDCVFKGTRWVWVYAACTLCGCAFVLPPCSVALTKRTYQFRRECDIFN